MMTTASLAVPSTPAAPRRRAARRVLPGFNITLGYTLLYLSLIVLIPLALKGVAYRAVGAASLLRRNLLVYGLGGVVVPFIGIKLIDLLIAAAGLA